MIAYAQAVEIQMGSFPSAVFAVSLSLYYDAAYAVFRLWMRYYDRVMTTLPLFSFLNISLSFQNRTVSQYGFSLAHSLFYCVNLLFSKDFSIFFYVLFPKFIL